MALKKGRKVPKKTGDTGVSAGDIKPITNKLDSTLVGESKRDKRALIKKVASDRRILFGFVVVVAIVGSAVFAYYQKEPVNQEKKAYVSAEGVAIRKLNDADLRAEVNKLSFQKKYNSARELIEFQDSGRNKENRLLFASTYINQENYAEAVKVFQEIERDFGEDWQVARSIGEQYEKLSDKDQAKTYYEKSLALLEKADNVPVKSDEIYFLKENIKRVQK